MSSQKTLAAPNTDKQVEFIPTRGFQTKSGLKYFDIKVSDGGPTPRYGQFVTFRYSGYYRPNQDSPLDLFDSSDLAPGKQPFLQKHGNGRVIRGIDEALHTMSVGSKRRVIIPKSIGYNDFGLGPLPQDPFRRRKLGRLLDFLDKEQGELIFDLELVSIVDDDNDQGYYDDEPVTQQEVRQLVLKSLQANADDKLLETMQKSTPSQLFKK
eukprot:CAMPEP_0201097086 /NCGR_PEP_ID=MMETSP0812-20130820/6145_1 /ASSEMBLY_ACC=CAM_ASM_000668 /TAXON_ID=98059 /ORGANISM="Dinobryon sp., Strain UTEXLB2267" /LENGTH=209 /DNA_ID=CAMNT_0047351785 /DNA_START=250 /DNA_END=879 /DNA_ORIENTATION=-